MSISKTCAAVSANLAEKAVLRDLATETAAQQAVESCNAAKQAVMDSAIATGDLKVFAIALRPAGEFARVSCPTSLEFGDRDIEYHGRRLSILADGHEAEAAYDIKKAEAFEQGELRAKREPRPVGKEILALHAKMVEFRTLAARRIVTARRIGEMIVLMKDEIAMREQSRIEHTARIEAERVARDTAVEAARIATEAVLAARKATQVTSVIQAEPTKTVKVVKPAAPKFSPSTTCDGFEGLALVLKRREAARKAAATRKAKKAVAQPVAA